MQFGVGIYSIKQDEVLFSLNQHERMVIHAPTDPLRHAFVSERRHADRLEPVLKGLQWCSEIEKKQTTGNEVERLSMAYV